MANSPQPNALWRQPATIVALHRVNSTFYLLGVYLWHLLSHLVRKNQKYNIIYNFKHGFTSILTFCIISRTNWHANSIWCFKIRNDSRSSSTITSNLLSSSFQFLVVILIFFSLNHHLTPFLTYMHKKMV